MPAKPVKSDLIGDGAVKYKVEQGPDSRAVISLHVDYSEAPIPPHFYVADYFYVEAAGFRVMIVFGKFDNAESRDKLRSKLEIFVPVTSFLRHMSGTVRQFHETMRKAGKMSGFPVVEQGSPAITADKIQTVQSNNILMAYADGECMLDFFYMSPRELHFNPVRKKDIELQALIRVMIDPPIMLALLDECEKIAEALTPKFPKEEDLYDSVESE